MIDTILDEVKDTKMPELEHCVGKTIKYDPNMDEEGLTSYTYNPTTNTALSIKFTVGEKAFVSLSYLYSTMRHEYVHVCQVLKDPKKTDKRTGLTEFGAYSWEILHAHETGLRRDPQAMTDMGQRLKAQGWDMMNPNEQAANQATYTQAIDVIRKAIGNQTWNP